MRVQNMKSNNQIVSNQRTLAILIRLGTITSVLLFAGLLLFFANYPLVSFRRLRLSLDLISSSTSIYASQACLVSFDSYDKSQEKDSSRKLLIYTPSPEAKSELIQFESSKGDQYTDISNTQAPYGGIFPQCKEVVLNEKDSHWGRKLKPLEYGKEDKTTDSGCVFLNRGDLIAIDFDKPAVVFASCSLTPEDLSMLDAEEALSIELNNSETPLSSRIVIQDYDILRCSNNINMSFLIRFPVRNENGELVQYNPNCKAVVLLRDDFSLFQTLLPKTLKMIRQRKD